MSNKKKKKGNKSVKEILEELDKNTEKIFGDDTKLQR